MWIYLFPLINAGLVVIVAGFWVQSGMFASSAVRPTYKWMNLTDFPTLGAVPDFTKQLDEFKAVGFDCGEFLKS